MIIDDVKSGSHAGRTVLPPQPVHPDPEPKRRADGNEPGSSSSDQRREPGLDRARLRHHVDQLEERVSRITNRLGFNLDDGTLVLEVLERASGRVLHRFPPEELGSLGERLDETASLVIDLYA